ncbi:MAG: FAD-dependent oxidoreductase [Acidimicrobiia bacterium]|nr:FAD-dependent oxidoreductase [Acidimicrobiia bacterium]
MDVAVIGAGLAGLAAAIELQTAGHAIQVFEATDRAGGRVQTDEVDGHLLDRGFQVLLDAYPEVWNLLDVAPLDLQYFAPGALTRFDGAFHRVTDPLQDPSGLLATLRSPVGSLGDKLRILSFRRAVRKGTLDDLWNRPERTALERLRDAGFGDDIIEHLLRPLFTGITLDPELSGSSRVLEFVFRMLSSGHTGVPARGMAAIPAQLAARLPADAIAVSTPVAAVDGSSTGAAIKLADGEVVSADAAIIATDASTAAELSDVTDHGWRPTTTVWFAADEPPISEPILVLNGEGSGPINSLAVMSEVSAAYAPAGRSTIAVSAPVIEPGLAADVRSQLGEWFGAVVDDWDVLRVDEIPKAHPIQPPGHDRSGVAAPGGDLGGRVLVCGDHRADPSINGALFSGRAAARTLLAGVDEPAPDDEPAPET